MPYIHVSTSKKITDEQKDRIIENLGKKISILEGKSEQWLMVKISDDQKMSFQGKIEIPCAIIEVSVYGSFSKREYQLLTENYTEIISEIVEIPKERIYIKYFETPYWGWSGNNF